MDPIFASDQMYVNFPDFQMGFCYRIDPGNGKLQILNLAVPESQL